MEEVNEKNPQGAVCAVCGLPKSRPGTVTAWIFQTSYCSCKGGAVVGLGNSELAHEPKVSELPLLGNRYKVLGPLGRGGVANVYKVQDSVTMNVLAAKVMLTELALNDLAVKRFQKEVDVLADLSHKNLVKIHGYAMDRNGIPYLIMDYVEGRNLEELIKIGGSLDADIQRAVNLFVQICAALIYVHENGIIHRDLKPSNVIVSAKPGTKTDHVTVIDFGFARNADGSGDSRLTRTGESFGSPAYMSPEHCLGQELDARSDIYSFGCLMYQALCGKPPIEGDNALATVAKQVKGDMASLRSVNSNVPKNLETVIMRCLEQEPAMRYQTVEDLELDLIRVLSGKHILSQARERGSKARFNSQRLLINRWVMLVAVVFLVVVSGLAGAWIASQSSNNRVSTGHQIEVRRATAPSPLPVSGTPVSVPVETKAPIDEPRRIKKLIPLRRPASEPQTIKAPPRKTRVQARPVEKQEAEGKHPGWDRWLELKKLRKFK